MIDLQSINYWLHIIKNKVDYTLRCQFKQHYPESVYFYTFHKCASSLFSGYVLKKSLGHYHIDYAAKIYTGQMGREDKVCFKSNGFIYGPIRLSAGKEGPVGEMLVEPASHQHFVRDKITVFLLRDPRDIMVSSYYSFGFTHGFSSVPEIREREKKVREKIRSMTIDEYVLHSADTQSELFRKIYELSLSSTRSVVLRYEDMIYDFDTFAKDLGTYLSLTPDTIRTIYRSTRPKKREDMTAHRRTGEPEGFRKKLQPQTIATVNQKLADVLDLFDYSR